MKNYYLKTEINWSELTKSQYDELETKGEVKIGDTTYKKAPLIAAGWNGFKYVEMYEVTENNVVNGFIPIGVEIDTNIFDGSRVGVNKMTIPFGVMYYVRIVLSDLEVYANCRFYPSIEDAIDYFNKVKDFVERCQLPESTGFKFEEQPVEEPKEEKKD